MSEFEIVFNVVIKATADNIEKLERTLSSYTVTLGDCVSEIYEDCVIVPFAWREVEDDDTDIDELLDHIYFDTGEDI